MGEEAKSPGNGKDSSSPQGKRKIAINFWNSFCENLSDSPADLGENCDTWLWTRVESWWEVGSGRLQGVEPLMAPEAESRKTEKSAISSGPNGLLP